MAGGNNFGLGDGTKELDKKSDRVTAMKDIGDNYVEDLETLRDGLDADDGSGTTLGTMVSTQINLTETDTGYQATSGIVNAVSKKNKDAAGETKRAAG